MVAIVIAEVEDIRRARAWAVLMAQAAGLADPGMVEQAVAEVGNNCLEHRDGQSPAVLRLGCHPGKLVVRAENLCRQRPTWQTAKPEAVDGFRLGGYGLVLIRAIAQDVRFQWREGRAIVRAEFA
jgi:Histidine kinase-like ATPase domain